MKRKDIISWDEYFMGLAHLSAKRSKDPNTQVGACIVDEDNRVVSIGYNGFPFGVDDDTFPWTKEGDFTDSKYAYVVHAELNAIISSNVNLKNHSLYVTLFPCNECAKAIIQSGIKTIYYESDKYKDQPNTIASKRMLEASGIRLIHLPYQIKVNLEINRN